MLKYRLLEIPLRIRKSEHEFALDQTVAEANYRTTLNSLKWWQFNQRNDAYHQQRCQWLKWNPTYLSFLEGTYQPPVGERVISFSIIDDDSLWIMFEGESEGISPYR